MKAMKLPLLVLGCLLAGSAFASDAPQGGQGDGQHSHHPFGPPPEFLAACKGQTVGAKVQVKTPRGDTISGTCQLMFAPDHPPGGEGGKGHGDTPPPQQ